MHYQLFMAPECSVIDPKSSKFPLIIWIGGGGPANSSLASAFNSIGPFSI